MSFVLICGVFCFFYPVRGSLLCFFFLRVQLLFSDFYHFHHVIWGMKWAKKLQTKNGQNMSSGPFSHDAAHLSLILATVACLLYNKNKNLMFLLLLLLLLSVWFSLHFEKPLCPSHPQVTVKSQNLTRQFFFCPHVAYCIFDGSSSDIPGFSWNVSLQKKRSTANFPLGNMDSTN